MLRYISAHMCVGLVALVPRRIMHYINTVGRRKEGGIVFSLVVTVSVVRSDSRLVWSGGVVMRIVIVQNVIIQ